MKAKIYTVYQGYNGYDVNMLVKARSRKKALEYARKQLDISTSARVLTNAMIEENELRKHVNKLTKKPVGACYVYDEGT